MGMRAAAASKTSVINGVVVVKVLLRNILPELDEEKKHQRLNFVINIIFSHCNLLWLYVFIELWSSPDRAFMQQSHLFCSVMNFFCCFSSGKKIVKQTLMVSFFWLSHYIMPFRAENLYLQGKWCRNINLYPRSAYFFADCYSCLNFSFALWW